MRADLVEPFASTAAGAIAENVLRACVHCGMCNATCPTYPLAGDERDGPRGRIYLLKQLLEGAEVGAETERHLDRCLSCRTCETTCPSGVEYHRLYDAGRMALRAQRPRPWPGRLARAAIRWLCLAPGLPRLAFALQGWRLRRGGDRKPAPDPAALTTTRRMALLRGCVQSAAAPQFNRAARTVFASIGVDLDESGAGCCGALSLHLEAPEEARALARRNIEAWNRALDAGAEAVVATASGCAAFIRDYPDLFAEEPQMHAKALRIAEAVRDPAEVLAETPPTPRRAPTDPVVAVHDPCTFKNSPAAKASVAAILANLGYQPQAPAGGPACCGSAGAYSILHPRTAATLRRDKLAALEAGDPTAIVTANVGCWMHLAAVSAVPVRHWLEAAAEVVEG